MSEIVYIGERLWAGQLGFFLTNASFIFLALSCFLFFNQKKEQALQSAQFAFYTHGVFLFSAIALLFYMLFNNLFEYHYIWQHSSRNLPVRYIFSCFWEGQEGSFILWMFWHFILGIILLRFGPKKHISTIMGVFSLVQLLIHSMILGYQFEFLKIGSNPFTTLLREHADFINMPLFRNASYLTQLDGRGLNPLLQNYWMTIHPPTLFLGFASMTIPFCFTMTALIKNSYKDVLNLSISWTYWVVAILGIGILMGGAWAYEALSFGGFWAWDPVENASLVPWLLIVSGAHLLLIYKNRALHLRSTLLFILLSFMSIVYSTFLTRSGILGETSVHAFVDLGLNGQLLFFLLSCTIIPLGLFVFRLKTLNKQVTSPELFWSKEFWMFSGTLILMISSIQITLSTSLPIINKLLEVLPIAFNKLAPSSNVINHYHKFQVPLTILLAFVLGASQLMHYKKDSLTAFIKKSSFELISSILLAILTFMLLNYQGSVGLQLSDIKTNVLINKSLFFLLLFVLYYAILANLSILKKVFQSSSNNYGSSVAHLGFLLILLGSQLSMGRQTVISENSSGVDVRSLDDQLNNGEHILLYKNDTLKMQDYYLSYRGMHKEGVNVFYQVDYMRKVDDGSFEHQFTLYPRVQTNDRMGNVSEPDTKHFIEKDIYTHVTYALLDELNIEDPEAYSENPKTYEIQIEDTFFTSNAMIVLESINKAVNAQDLGLAENQLAVGAFLKIQDMNKNSYNAKPIYVLDTQGHTQTIADVIEPLGLKFSFDKIEPLKQRFTINVFEKNKNYKEFIVLKAVVFPGINVLWIGCILMFFGCILSVWHKVKP